MRDAAAGDALSNQAPSLEPAHTHALDRAMAIAIFDLQGTLIYANPNYLALLGLDAGSALGRMHHSFCPDGFRHSPSYNAFWERMRRGQPYSGTVERLKSDGSSSWLQATYTPVLNPQGQATQVLKVATDVTERLKAEQAQQKTFDMLSMVANATDSAILITDSQSGIVYVNAGFSRMFGWSLPEAKGQDPMELLAPHVDAPFKENYRHSLRSGQGTGREAVVNSKGGQRYWVKALSNPVFEEDGTWSFTVSVLTDITASKIHETLQRSVLEAMARDQPLSEVLDLVCREVESIAPEIAASILEVDDDGLLHPLSSPSLPASYSSLLDGVASGPYVGSCGTAVWHKQPVVVNDIATDPLWTDFKHLILPLGYHSCWSTPILNSSGKVLGTFAFYYRQQRTEACAELHQRLVNACTHLCTLALERERTRAHIRKLAFYDALTGLPNRSLLLAKADQVLASAANANAPTAVLFIDLDRFKQVNDSLGHTAGDELLCSVAERVQHVLRPTDIVGRLSGDEFVAVLPQCSAEHVANTIDRLQELLVQPTRVSQTHLALTASIGIAMFPTDGRDMETLLQRADMAMAKAKHGGRGRFSFFSSEMNQLAQERLVLENALRIALQSNGLSLHYQPQINMCDNQLYGVEALARWHHPELGFISPARFIPLAEECGLIAELGRWALQEACQQLAQWRARELPVPAVSVNLSPSSFHNLELPQMIADILARNGLRPGDLTLELTESIALDGNPATMQVIHELHAQGIRLSMDDFGTGYSSLSYLRRLPVSELKLDRSFVADLEDDAAAQSLSRAIMGIGSSLDLTVVAEGIETSTQHQMLREQGYSVAQGYLFSRPLSAQDLEQWLNTSAHVPPNSTKH